MRKLYFEPKRRRKELEERKTGAARHTKERFIQASIWHVFIYYKKLFPFNAASQESYKIPVLEF